MGNYNYCSSCGASLETLPTPDGMWLNAYRCSNPLCHKTYLEVLDMRCLFPLIETFPNIPEKLMEATPDMQRQAKLRIRQIDYKTVSIVGLENILLGVDK